MTMFYSGWSYGNGDNAPTNYGLSVYLHDLVPESALSSELRVCRLNHKGHAETWQIVADAQAAAARGDWLQFENERNHWLESWALGAAAHLEQQKAFARAFPNATIVSMPPSPGFEGYEAWFPNADDVDVIGVHCYGPLWLMIQHLEAAKRAANGKPIIVTECNPGWGNTFNINEWVRDHARAFWGKCIADPQVVGIAYFAPNWNPDTPGETSINGTGTDVELLLAQFSKIERTITKPNVPQEGPQEMEYRTVLSDHWQDRGQGFPEYLILHTTEGNSSWERAIEYLRHNEAEVSAHRLVGEWECIIMVPDHLAANTAGASSARLPNGRQGRNVNLYSWNLEMYNRQGITPTGRVQANAAIEVAAACRRLKIPTSKVISHQQVDPTRRTDPTGVSLPAFRAVVNTLLASGGDGRDWDKAAYWAEEAARQARKAGDSAAHRTIVADVLPTIYSYRRAATGR